MFYTLLRHRLKKDWNSDCSVGVENEGLTGAGQLEWLHEWEDGDGNLMGQDSRKPRRRGLGITDSNSLHRLPKEQRNEALAHEAYEVRGLFFIVFLPFF